MRSKYSVYCEMHSSYAGEPAVVVMHIIEPLMIVVVLLSVTHPDATLRCM